jgi:hypothetical protein
MGTEPPLRQDALLGRVTISLLTLTAVLFGVVAGLAVLVPEIALGTSRECNFLAQLFSSDAKTCTQATKEMLRANIAMSGNWPSGMLPPVWFGWLDTFLVDVYSALFIVAIAWAYQRLSGQWNGKPVFTPETTRILKRVLVVSIALVLMGAMCDLAENFLAMAQVHDGLKTGASVGGTKVELLAALTMTKFVLVPLNFLQAMCWMRAAYWAISRLHVQPK